MKGYLEFFFSHVSCGLLLENDCPCLIQGITQTALHYFLLAYVMFCTQIPPRATLPFVLLRLIKMKFPVSCLDQYRLFIPSKISGIVPILEIIVTKNGSGLVKLSVCHAKMLSVFSCVPYILISNPTKLYFTLCPSWVNFIN